MVTHHHHHRPYRLVLLDNTKSNSPPPSANENRSSPTRGSYVSEANFDTNMVIILAALLCALICALGLNSIVRCALRCSRRFAFETPDEAVARLAATGLKKSALRKIPVAAYGASSGIKIIDTDCTICLGEFEEGDKVRVLPKCSHGFHVRCIDPWLVSHSSCPTCRRSLLEQPASSDAATVESGAGIRHHGNAADSEGGGGQGIIKRRKAYGTQGIIKLLLIEWNLSSLLPTFFFSSYHFSGPGQAHNQEKPFMHYLRTLSL